MKIVTECLFIHVFRVFNLLFNYYLKNYLSNIMTNRKLQSSSFSHGAILEMSVNLMRSLTYTFFVLIVYQFVTFHFA